MHALKIAVLGAALAGVAAAGVNNEPRWASDCTGVSTVVVTVTVHPDWCTPPATSSIPSAPNVSGLTSVPAVPSVPVATSGTPPASVVLPTVPASISSGSASVPPGEAPITGLSPSSSSTPVVSVTTAAHTSTSTGSIYFPATTSQPPAPTVSTGAGSAPAASDSVMAGLLLAGAVINGAFVVLF